MAYILNSVTGMNWGIYNPVIFGGFIGAKISPVVMWDPGPKVSALHLAAASGDLEAFQEMIKAQAGDATAVFFTVEKTRDFLGKDEETIEHTFGWWVMIIHS